MPRGLLASGSVVHERAALFHASAIPFAVLLKATCGVDYGLSPDSINKT
jgi:hypothetical protein